MAGRLTERMAAVLTTAAGRTDGRAFNDGRPNYLAARAGLIRRGYLAERGGDDVLTATGRVAIAGRIDAAKLAGQTEAAELAELAHRGELARRLGWRPAGGDRVQIIGQAGGGRVLYNGHDRDDWQCRICGRRCVVIDVATDTGSHHYGYSQCEVAPTVDTLAANLTARANMLRDAIDLDPAYPAADRWRVELARFRRLAAEVTEAGPVAELAGPVAAELAEAADRAAAAYMADVPGSGPIMAAWCDAVRAARAGDMSTAASLAGTAAVAATRAAEVATRQAAELADRAAAEMAEVAAEAAERVADPAPRWHTDSHLPVAAFPDYDDNAEAAEAADEWAAHLAELAGEAEAGELRSLRTLAELAEHHADARAELADLIGRGVIPCRWYAACDRAASHLAEHPVLRRVPACGRCHPATDTPEPATT